MGGLVAPTFVLSEQRNDSNRTDLKIGRSAAYQNITLLLLDGPMHYKQLWFGPFFRLIWARVLKLLDFKKHLILQLMQNIGSF